MSNFNKKIFCLTFILIFISNCKLFAQQSYLIKENRIAVKVKPKAVYCSSNYETFGTNDFVYKAKVEDVTVLSCFTAKVPVIPSWAIIFDPFAYALANELGITDRNRLKEVGEPNGWSILEYNGIVENKDHISIYKEMYEDDKGERCTYDKKDDGHCGALDKWATNFYFRDYAPNHPHRIEVSCGSYKIWFEFEWSPVCDDNIFNRYICDIIINNGLTGNLCSNYCPNSNNDYGKLTFASPHITNAGINIYYQWQFNINSGLYTFTDQGMNKYYSTPPLYNILKNMNNVSFTMEVTLNRTAYNAINNNYIGPLNPHNSTIDLSAITPVYNGTPLTIPPKCNEGKDGVIIVDISKLESPVFPPQYQISYSDIAGNVYGTDDSFPQGVSIRDTLLSGNYIVQIGNFISNTSSKAVGCPLNIPVTVPERPLLEANYESIPYTHTDVSCRDNPDGRILLKVTGGKTPYKVTSDPLLPDADWVRIHVADGTTGYHTFQGLSPDVPYTFAVSDSFNCPLNGQRRIDLPYTLTNPDSLRFSYVLLSEYHADTLYKTQWNVSCYGANDGSIRTLVDEYTTPNSRRYANPPFRIWLTGTTTQGVAVFEDTVATSNTALDGSLPTTFENLYAGTYTLHVLDNNDCYYSEVHTLSEPPKLEISILNFLDNKCSGDAQGMFKTKTLGGTRPYIYYKDNLNQAPGASASPYYLCYGIGYTTSCLNPDNSYQQDTPKETYDTIATLSNLIFGNHTLFAKDINGCVSTISRYINQPAPLSADLEGKNISCKGANDGTLKATGTGGTAPYHYQWTLNGQPIGTTDYIDQLAPGYYQLDMTDANGCTAGENSSAYAMINNPLESLTATTSVAKTPTCADREDAILNIEVQGGWTPYYYSLDGSKYQREEPNFTKLRAGTYSNLHVRDGNGCTIKLAPAHIVDPGKLTATELQPSIVSCKGSTDGTILLEISGGNKPYTAGLGSVLSEVPDSVVRFQHLSPGAYTIHIADAQKCLLDKQITVAAPEKLQDRILHITDATPFLANGTATIQAYGGTPPYSYQWGTLQQNSFSGPVTMLNLAAGFQTVIITDSKRCVDTAYVGINHAGGPVYVGTTTIAPSCSYSADGSSTVHFTAATDLTYQWLHGPTGQTLSGLQQGIYYLTVTDAHGLISTRADTVAAPDPIAVLLATKPSACFGDCEGTIQATVKGGTQPYSLQWNDPSAQTGDIAANLCEGLYKLRITDAHACTATDSVSLLNPDPVEIDLGGSATICYGQVMTLDAQNPGSSYYWTSSNPDFEAHTQSIQVIGEGTYYVQVITPYGCSGTDTFQLKNSKNLLEALFYVSTKNYANDTVVFVDVSYPLPEKLEWDFGNKAVVLKSEPAAQHVIFPEAGFYDVKMTAFLGECSDTLIKRIKIFDPNDTGGYSSGKKGIAAIRSLYAYPNPNDGSFEVVLELNAEHESELLLHDFTGTVIRKIPLGKNVHFEVPFNLNQMSRGVYFVRAIAGGETLSVVVTVQ
jgi:hypothetical protein